MKTIKILGDSLNKVSDTTEVFKFLLFKDYTQVDVTGKELSLTVANDSGFLFDTTPVNSGTEVWVDFNDEKLKTLTPDTYQLEIRVTNDDGDVEIYPSEGAIPFTVVKNLHSSTGQTVPQITFDEVLKAVDDKVTEYTSTIAKGDKGDTGDTGPKGDSGPKGDKGDIGATGPQGPKGDTGVVDYTKTVNTTGDQTIAGEKTFSDKLTINGVSQANYWYKSVSNTSANPIMEVQDKNTNSLNAIGYYYSGDASGQGVTLGAGGLTVVGGGESAKNVTDHIAAGDTNINAWPIAAGISDEHTIISSDKAIYFFENQQISPTYTNIWRLNTSGYWDRYDTTAGKWINVIPNTSGLLAQDAYVVHNSGNESVTGVKTFTNGVDGVEVKHEKTISAFGGTVTFTRVGNVVTMYSAVYNANFPFGAFAETYPAGTIPAGYRPAHNYFGINFDTATGGTNDRKPGIIGVHADGSIVAQEAYVKDTGKTWISLAGTYVTADDMP